MTEQNTDQTPESVDTPEEQENTATFQSPEAQRPEQSEEDLAKASDVEEYMHDVIDPELGINVVDLGLVYDVYIINGNEAHIDMTLTSPACPLTDVIEDQARQAVVGSGVVEKMSLNWVWMPPWGPERITDDGRDQMRALGFNI